MAAALREVIGVEQGHIIVVAAGSCGIDGVRKGAAASIEDRHQYMAGI